ncbi:MAG: restriction endonuclease [Deltaproteobacteria bacterium]|nr:restriction endonuclease [Deltaproteobacteria bacterium]
MPQEIDEQALCKMLMRAAPRPQITMSRFTPAGRLRRSPLFQADIANAFLGKAQSIKGQTRFEVESKAREKLEAWARLEAKRRSGEAKADALEAAQARHQELVATLRSDAQALREVLKATLSVDDRIDWLALLDRRSYTCFQWSDKPPKRLGAPQSGHKAAARSNWLASARERRRRARVQQATQLEARALTDEVERANAHEAYAYQVRRADALLAHLLEHDRFLTVQYVHNRDLRAFRARFEAGSPKAVAEYLETVFERAEYPASLRLRHKVAVSEDARKAQVDLTMVAYEDFPNVADYKFVKKTRESRPIAMKRAEQESLYEEVVVQLVVRVMHEVFEAVYIDAVHEVAVNCWVEVADRSAAAGKDADGDGTEGTGPNNARCIAAVQSERDTFEAINLARKSPSSVLESLDGRVSKSCHGAEAVEPRCLVVWSGATTDSSKSETLRRLMDMSGDGFGALARSLLERMVDEEGGRLQSFATSADGEVDATATLGAEDDLCAFAVRRHARTIPDDAVHDLLRRVESEGLGRAMLLSTGTFDKDAERGIQNDSVVIVDGPRLVSLLALHGVG